MKNIVANWCGRWIASAVVGAAAVSAFVFPAAEADACSRVEYVGKDSVYVVGRALDWKTPIPTNLYVYPRGMEKRSSDHDNCIRWRSKYGAVYAVGYDGGITEGMNERGLVVNGLFCKGTVYNDTTVCDDKKPYMSLAMFVAWLLDRDETVEEVCRDLEHHDFQIQGATFDGGTVSALHWGVTDRTGKSIIFEFDHGTIHVYDMGEYRAMTNDPQWPKMTGIIDYWEKIGGSHFLPGSVSSPDRCVRANFFAHNVEQTGDTDLGVSIARSILLNTSVPYTYEVEGSSNLSSTQWRSYAVPRDGRYYFELVTNPGYYYVDLSTLNLAAGSPVQKLDTSKTSNLVGCANARLVAATPFTPMY